MMGMNPADFVLKRLKQCPSTNYLSNKMEIPYTFVYKFIRDKSGNEEILAPRDDFRQFVAELFTIKLNFLENLANRTIFSARCCLVAGLLISFFGRSSFGTSVFLHLNECILFA